MKLAIDCGGSIIRIGTGLMQDEYPSAYKVIKQDYIPPEVNSSEVAELTCDDFRLKIAKGQSSNYFNSTIQEQRNDMTKTESEVTHVNIAYAVARFLYERCEGNDEIQNIELLLALPPREVYSELREQMKEKLMQDYNVVFEGGEEVNFKITKVNVMAEGLAAFAAIDNDFQGLNVMIVDSGYRSTEVCVVRDYVPVNGALETYSIGGLNLEADLEKILSKHGYQLGSQEIRECLADGVTQRKIKVGPLVRSIKEEFADELYKIMNNVANMSGVPLASIQVLVLTGRVFDETGTEDDQKTYGDSIKNLISGRVGATVYAGFQNIEGLCASL